VPLKAVRVLGRVHALVRRLRNPVGADSMIAAQVPA
jgi:hypothetical protein